MTVVHHPMAGSEQRNWRVGAWVWAGQASSDLVFSGCSESLAKVLWRHL